jgi:hypothetical protein
MLFVPRATTKSAASKRDPRGASAASGANPTCRELTIGRPKIRGVPVRPFMRDREIVHMCSRLWRLVRGRRHRVSWALGLRYPLSLTGSPGSPRYQASI